MGYKDTFRKMTMPLIVGVMTSVAALGQAVNVMPGIGVAVDDQNRTIYADPVTQTLNRSETNGTTTLIASGKPFDHVDVRGTSIMVHDEDGDVNQYIETSTPGTFTENFIANVGDIDELEQDNDLIYILQDGEVYAGGTVLVTNDGNILDTGIGVDFFTQNTVMYTVSTNGSINYYSNVGTGVSPVQFDDIDGAQNVEYDDTTGEIVVGIDNGDVLLYPTPGSSSNSVIGNVDNLKDLDYANGDAHATNGEQAALPVELLSFNARQDNTHVALSWATATEINNDKFIVQRSFDNTQWDNIGEVQGKGDNSTYDFIDKDVQNGQSYYRLKQIDLDGRFEIHKTASVKISGLDLTVAPNPADTDVTINAEDIQSIKLYNNMGQLVIDFKNAAANTNIQLDVSDLNAGMYHMRTETSFAVIQNKLMIK